MLHKDFHTLYSWTELLLYARGGGMVQKCSMDGGIFLW